MLRKQNEVTFLFVSKPSSVDPPLLNGWKNIKVTGVLIHTTVEDQVTNALLLTDGAGDIIFLTEFPNM